MIIISDIDVVSYADDNTSHDFNILKSNPHKRDLPLSRNENKTVKTGEYKIENNEWEKLLDVQLDWKLNFDDHISDTRKKVGGKLSALVIVERFIGLSKRQTLMNGFFNSQFDCCLLI